MHDMFLDDCTSITRRLGSAQGLVWETGRSDLACVLRFRTLDVFGIDIPIL